MNPKVFLRYGPNSDYYTRFQVRGKRVLWCTKTNNKQLAVHRARDHRDKLMAGAYHLVSLQKSNTKVATFEQLIKEYEGLPISCAKTTRNKNVASLRRILAAAGLSEKDGVDRIGAEVATTWQRSSLIPQGNPTHGAIVSSNSRLRQARSLFSRRAMGFYQCKLPQDQIRAFMEVPLTQESEHMREMATPEMMAAAEAVLPRFPAEWCAYLLAKYAGLRPVEIKVARWDWIRDGILRVGGWSGVAKTKNRRFREVRLDPAIVNEMLKSKTSDDYICGPSPKLTVERKLSVMMRAWGFSMADPIYSLRRWHASWRYENQSPSAARDALGHATESVTMRHYATRFSRPAPIPFSGERPSPAPAEQAQSGCSSPAPLAQPQSAAESSEQQN